MRPEERERRKQLSAQADAERRFAQSDDLSEEDFEELQLPKRGDWVRVRYLSTPEIASLTHLPDLADYVRLVMQLASKDDERRQDTDSARLTQENYRYAAHVAHMAIFTGEEPSAPIKCEEAGCGLEHPASLWSLKQALKLHTTDLDTIMLAALKDQTVGRLVPFFAGPPQGDSAVPASSSE